LESAADAGACGDDIASGSGGVRVFLDLLANRLMVI
jgi:hypothetical protein